MYSEATFSFYICHMWSRSDRIASSMPSWEKEKTKPLHINDSLELRKEKEKKYCEIKAQSKSRRMGKLKLTAIIPFAGLFYFFSSAASVVRSRCQARLVNCIRTRKKLRRKRAIKLRKEKIDISISVAPAATACASISMERDGGW